MFHVHKWAWQEEEKREIDANHSSGGTRNLQPQQPVPTRSESFSRTPGDAQGINAELASNQARHGCVCRYPSD
jgi:hypothetical protein